MNDVWYDKNNRTRASYRPVKGLTSENFPEKMQAALEACKRVINDERIDPAFRLGVTLAIVIESTKECHNEL